MMLLSCRGAAWNVLRMDSDNREHGRLIWLEAARIFELGYAVRHGLRPSRARAAETEAMIRMHEHFSGLCGVGVRRAAAPRCDICLVGESLRQLSRSAYGAACARVILASRDSGRMNALAQIDWQEAFERFVAETGRCAGEPTITRMTRTACIFGAVRNLMRADAAGASRSSSGPANAAQKRFRTEPDRHLRRGDGLLDQVFAEIEVEGSCHLRML